MKLRQISGLIQQKQKSAPTISLNFLNGRIYFNESTKHILDLKEGDRLVFYQDEDNLKGWYFMKSKIEGSIELRILNKALVAFNGSIARAILHSVSMDATSAFFIAEERVEGKYWKILTDRVIKP